MKFLIVILPFVFHLFSIKINALPLNADDSAYVNKILANCEMNANNDSISKLIAIVDSININSNLQFTDKQLYKISKIYERLGDYDKTIFYTYSYINYFIRKNLAIKKINKITNQLNYIAYYYTLKGDDKRAIQILNFNLELISIFKLNKQLPHTYLIFGFAYRNRDAKEALEYFKKSLYYAEESQFTDYDHYAYNEIGNCFVLMEQFDSATFYLKKALQIRLKKNIKQALSYSYNDIANLYIIMRQYNSAYAYMLIAYNLDRQSKSTWDLAFSSVGLANIIIKMNRIYETKHYLNEGFIYVQKVNLPYLWKNYYYINYLYYSEIGKYNQALENYIKYHQYSDTLVNIEKEKQIAALQSQYHIEQKNKEIRIKDLNLRNQQEKINRQRLTIALFLGGSIIIFLLLLWIFKLYIFKKNSNILLAEKNSLLEQYNVELTQQKEEIVNQRDYIEVQKNNIELINKNLIDSINYAKNFQQALLPPAEILHAVLKNFFIVYLPKDIVSGDFYWLHPLDNSNSEFIIAAADCTGHGVPGAFMSVIGNTLLKEAVIENKISQPNKIIDYISENITKVLHFQHKEGAYKDSMDIAVCKINFEKRIFQFSGALSRIILLCECELIEFRGDEVPLGLENEFPKHQFQLYEQALKSNTMIYLFSDGFADQFGKNNRKYLYKNFKKLLSEISDMPPQVQKNILMTELKEWQGNQPQTDDIMIIGIHVA